MKCLHLMSFILQHIAALHFNENYGKEQAKTADSTERLRVCFPKLKQLCFAGYVDDLIEKTMQYCLKDDDKPSLPTAPPSLASAYMHSDKDHIPLF